MENSKKLTDLKDAEIDFVNDILEKFDENNVVEVIKGMATAIDFLKRRGYDVLGNNLTNGGNHE